MTELQYANLIENIAEEMWFLIRSKDSLDWPWCVAHLPKTAADLRERAESVVEKSTLLTEKDRPKEPGRLDLRIKEALIRNV